MDIANAKLVNERHLKEEEEKKSAKLEASLQAKTKEVNLWMKQCVMMQQENVKLLEQNTKHLVELRNFEGISIKYEIEIKGLRATMNKQQQNELNLTRDNFALDAEVYTLNDKLIKTLKENGNLKEKVKALEIELNALKSKKNTSKSDNDNCDEPPQKRMRID